MKHILVIVILISFGIPGLFAQQPKNSPETTTDLTETMETLEQILNNIEIPDLDWEVLIKDIEKSIPNPEEMELLMKSLGENLPSNLEMERFIEDEAGQLFKELEHLDLSELENIFSGKEQVLKELDLNIQISGKEGPKKIRKI